MAKECPDEIHISTGTMVRAVLVILAFVALFVLRDVAFVILTAVVLASAAEPAARFLVGKKLPRLLALVLIYVSAISVVGGLIYFFVPAILDDVALVTRKLSTAATAPTAEKTLTVAAGGGTTALLNSFISGARESADVLDIFRDSIEKGGTFEAATAFFGGFLSLILIVVLSFYLAAQERGIENFLRLITPVASRAYIVDLWKRSQAKIGLWFQGQLLLGLLVGILAFLGLSILGVSSALLLALLIAIFELIPVFGPILAATPAVLIAFSEGIRGVDPGFTAAIFVATFYFIIQQFESHLIYPLVVRKVVGIPPVLVILALVIGAKLAGFMGIVLAVPLTAILIEFLNDVAKERRIYDDA